MNVNNLIGKTLSMVQSTEQKEMLQKLVSLNKEYMKKVDQTIALLPKGREEAEVFANKEAVPLVREMGNIAQTIVERQQKQEVVIRFRV